MMSGGSCRGERGEQVVEGGLVDLETVGVVGEEGFHEGGFLGLEFLDALFDCALADEFVDKDGLVLPDAVGAVGGLVFGGGIPPGVVVDDGVGGGEVEAGASCLEGNEDFLSSFRQGAEGGVSGGRTEMG